jgi:hypothetical protein
MMQAIVTSRIQDFVKLPPRQEPAWFSLICRLHVNPESKQHP